MFDVGDSEGSGGDHEIDAGEQGSRGKRPLDLGPFDEEDEMERLKTVGDEQEGGEMLKKKATKKRRVFNAEMLTSAAGIQRVYEDFSSSRALEGNERARLSNLISKYKAWAFQLFPNLAFNDLISRCETLGTKAHVRSYLEVLRERERNRYLRDILGVAPEDIVMTISSAAGAEDSFGATSHEDYDSPAPWDKPSRAEALSTNARQSHQGGTQIANPLNTNGAEEEEVELDIDWAAVDAMSGGLQSVSAEPSEDQEAHLELKRAADNAGVAAATTGEEEDGADHDDEMEAMAEMERMEYARHQ